MPYDLHDAYETHPCRRCGRAVHLDERTGEWWSIPDSGPGEYVNVCPNAENHEHAPWGA